jgi:hypothetical protein
MVRLIWGGGDITATLSIQVSSSSGQQSPRVKGIYSCHVCKNKITLDRNHYDISENYMDIVSRLHGQIIEDSINAVYKITSKIIDSF